MLELRFYHSVFFFSAQVEKFIEKNEEEHLSLDPCSAFQRKLTYQAVNAKYVLNTRLNGIQAQGYKNFFFFLLNQAFS